MASPLSAANAYATAARSFTGAGGPLKSALSGGEGTGKPDFASMVSNALNATMATTQAADKQAAAAVTGKADIVDVVTAVAESETAIETLVAVRDRVIAAYDDIMKMTI